MISLTLNEVLYLVLIGAVIVLTVYLAITLSRLNAVLADIGKVSHLLSVLAGAVEKVGTLAVPALTGLVAALERFAAAPTRKKKKQ